MAGAAAYACGEIEDSGCKREFPAQLNAGSGQRQDEKRSNKLTTCWTKQIRVRALSHARGIGREEEVKKMKIVYVTMQEDGAEGKGGMQRRCHSKMRDLKTSNY